MPSHDPVRYAAHYELFPVQPREITIYLGYALGSMVERVLRAPWENGVEDCERALDYLPWLEEEPQPQLGHRAYENCRDALTELIDFMMDAKGDQLWQDIANWQARFLWDVRNYLCERDTHGNGISYLTSMDHYIRELSRVISLRDTTGQIYEGMTGLPQKPEEEG